MMVVSVQCTHGGDLYVQCNLCIFVSKKKIQLHKLMWILACETDEETLERSCCACRLGPLFFSMHLDAFGSPILLYHVTLSCTNCDDIYSQVAGHSEILKGSVLLYTLVLGVCMCVWLLTSQLPALLAGQWLQWPVQLSHHLLFHCFIYFNLTSGDSLTSVLLCEI